MPARFLAILCLVPALAAAQLPLIEKVEGQGSFAVEDAAVVGLSGLVWQGGDAFVAVSDRLKALVPVTLKVDLASGRITAGEIGKPVPVPTEVSDFEGVTYIAAAKAFYLSAEQGAAVVRYVPGEAKATRLPVPAVYAKARKNLSLEALTWNDTAKQFWLSNEETLAPDGALASAADGSLARLQRLDARFRPVAQYAWRTEPAAMRFSGAGSGVPDLCLLPDGRLLVLERGFGGFGLQARIYLADFSHATNVAKLPALAGAQFTPARKILLFEQATGFVNYEGLALGPKLADGTRSLILVADSGSEATHHFLPLKIRLGPVSAAKK
jgi:Esterase-like activity of phytase